MEPRIQYARTSDGVNIAYYTMGGREGLPVVWLELPSHLLRERMFFPDQARGYQLMSRFGMLVRYDHRGFGLSDRSITNFALDEIVKDLEAVVDKLDLQLFAVLAAGGFAPPVAVAYTASHPGRVSKLVILGGLLGVAPALYQQVQALMLPNSDWRFVPETVSRLLGLGWDDEEVSRRLAAWVREASTYETFLAFWRDFENWDVRSPRPTITAPTLLVTFPDHPGTKQALEAASLMPDAQLVMADGATYDERIRTYEAAVGTFLYGSAGISPAETREARAAATLPTGTAIILFADIADSTALTERLGDDAFRAKARELDDALRAVIRDQNGTPIEGKLLGDGVLAVFTSARQAIEAALACGGAGSHAGLPLHLGLHAGDVTREEDPDGRDNVYGGAVNIASRISGLSAPGEVLVSETVRSLARTSAGVGFEDRGEQSLKGVGEPMRVWAVREVE